MNRWNLGAGIVISILLIGGIALLTHVARNDGSFQISGAELKDDEIRISSFSRHMKITTWTWSDTDHSGQKDNAIYLDTVYFRNPHKRPILWHDNTVVRGQVFVDFISAPWRLVAPPEYKDWS